jgi:hypothetical protein
MKAETWVTTLWELKNRAKKKEVSEVNRNMFTYLLVPGQEP